jgi:hypothetical protein
MDRWNIEIAHRHRNVEIGTEARAIPRKGIHKWDFRCSVVLDIQSQERFGKKVKDGQILLSCR